MTRYRGGLRTLLEEGEFALRYRASSQYAQCRDSLAEVTEDLSRATAFEGEREVARTAQIPAVGELSATDLVQAVAPCSERHAVDLLREELRKRPCGEGLVGEDEVEGRCANEGVAMALEM